MKKTAPSMVVFVTAPDLRTARKLGRTALSERLIACANILPEIESHYWWKNKMETSREVLLLMKTTAARVRALETLIRRKHPYEVPEFIALKIAYGNAAYLKWLFASSTTKKRIS